MWVDVHNSIHLFFFHIQRYVTKYQFAKHNWNNEAIHD